jgi:post-segregation antitoxin (ccd killing protein)
MALIKPKNRTKKTKVRIELDVQVLEELKLYQECINEDDTSYVIQEAIKQLFKAKEYRDWKKEREENS